MKIETTRFGSQEIEHETVLNFPNGLLDNTQLKDFKLFHKEDSDTNDAENNSPVVFWLQSVDQPKIAYSIFDPALANFYYKVLLPDDDQALLASENDSQKDNDEIVMMVIVKDADNNVQQDGLTLVNANITEPLFINLTSLKGLQRSIKDLDYDIFLNIPVLSN